MCFDDCSPPLSPTHLEKPQPQPIIYLLRRFHGSEMFSHKCTYCAPVSQLFMLWLCHSSMSSHPFQQRGKNEREGERRREAVRDRRDRPVEWHFVCASRLLCAGGDNTSHCHYTGWHTYTGPKQPQDHTHTHTHEYFPLFSCQHWQILVCGCFHQDSSILFLLLMVWQVVADTDSMCSSQQYNQSTLRLIINPLNAIQRKSLSF